MKTKANGVTSLHFQKKKGQDFNVFNYIFDGDHFIFTFKMAWIFSKNQYSIKQIFKMFVVMKLTQ